MTEHAPTGSKPRMTKAQMRKYLRDMKEAQKRAKKKLDPEKEQAEKHHDIKKLEDKLDDVF